MAESRFTGPSNLALSNANTTPGVQAAVNSLLGGGNATAGNTDNMNTSVAQLAASELDARARELANKIVADLARQTQQASSGRVFTRFNPVDDVIGNQKTFVTTGLFSNNEPTMGFAFTSSLQTTSSKLYYYDVLNSTASNAESQFAIAYGHRLGSGSSAQGTLNDSPTRAVYSQYRLLLLNPEDTTFNIRSGSSTTATDSIYVINFNRARLKDRLDPGNWQISLNSLSGSSFANNVHTGSNVRAQGAAGRIFSVIDDSGLGNTPTLTTAGRVFNVVSGTLTGGIFNPTAPVYIGLVYPDMGIAVLDARQLEGAANLGLNFNTVTGSNVAGDNAFKLFTSISGAMTVNRTTHAIQARNEETVTSTHYFVRVKNAEYNFSNNPTFVTGTVGEFVQPTFIGDPKVYITTVGMYNDRQELLAVAKLSKPIQKSFNNEALIKVKLDF
jgi:hypothetical protein